MITMRSSPRSTTFISTPWFQACIYQLRIKTFTGAHADMETEIEKWRAKRKCPLTTKLIQNVYEICQLESSRNMKSTLLLRKPHRNSASLGHNSNSYWEIKFPGYVVFWSQDVKRSNLRVILQIMKQ